MRDAFGAEGLVTCISQLKKGRKNNFALLWWPASLDAHHSGLTMSMGISFWSRTAERARLQPSWYEFRDEDCTSVFHSLCSILFSNLFQKEFLSWNDVSMNVEFIFGNTEKENETLDFRVMPPTAQALISGTQPFFFLRPLNTEHWTPNSNKSSTATSLSSTPLSLSAPSPQSSM